MSGRCVGGPTRRTGCKSEPALPALRRRRRAGSLTARFPAVPCRAPAVAYAGRPGASTGAAAVKRVMGAVAAAAAVRMRAPVLPARCCRRWAAASSAPGDRAVPVRPSGGSRLDTRLAASPSSPPRRATAPPSTRGALGVDAARGAVRVVVRGRDRRVRGRRRRRRRRPRRVDVRLRGRGDGCAGRARAARGAAGVRFVAPPARPIPLAVAGQEVATSTPSGWQSAGVTGAGTTVADPRRRVRDLDAAQANGEVPGDVTRGDFCNGEVLDGERPRHRRRGDRPRGRARSASPARVRASPDDLLAAEQWARGPWSDGRQPLGRLVQHCARRRLGGAGTPDAAVADAGPTTCSG